MHFNKISSTINKQLLFLLCIFILSSCGSKKEDTLLKVLEAIEEDTISTITELCTPKAFEQIQLRKSVFQSLLLSDWDLRYNHVKCSEGESVSHCYICDEFENCIPVDYLKLRNIDGKWLVDHNEYAPTVVVEQFLGHLEKMDLEAARKIAGPKLRKELKAIESMIAVLKETGALTPKEIKNLKQGITTVTSFSPALEWLKCNSDASYPNTKVCFLCNSLYGQTNKGIRVTRMKDKKWYVEHYNE
jgi:hypothetical protein